MFQAPSFPCLPEILKFIAETIWRVELNLCCFIPCTSHNPTGSLFSWILKGSKCLKFKTSIPGSPSFPFFNTILNQLRKLTLVISNGTILWQEKGQSSTSNTYLYSTLKRALLCPDSTSLMNENVWHSLMQHICEKRKKGTHICNDHCKCNFFVVTNVVINSLWMGSGYTKIRIITVNT